MNEMVNNYLNDIYEIDLYVYDNETADAFKIAEELDFEIEWRLDNQPEPQNIFVCVDKKTRDENKSAEFIPHLAEQFSISEDEAKAFYEDWVHGKLEILEPKIDEVISIIGERMPDTKITTEMIKKALGDLEAFKSNSEYSLVD